MNSALESVLGTSFGLDAAATAAASAVAAGVKPGKDLTRVLSLTGDAATIMGTDFNEAGQIINKVLAGNRLTMREVNQMHAAGMPILSQLADQYGVTAAEMSDMVSRGEVDSKMFLKAIETNIGGAALESGKTVRGAWANMQAAMARVGAEIVKDILPRIGNAFGRITKWFDDNSENIVKAFGRIADGLRVFGRLLTILPIEATLMIIAGAIMMGVVPALKAMAVSLWATFAPLIPFLAAGAALGAVAYVIKRNWNSIAPVFNAVRTALIGLWNITKPLRDFIANQFKKAWEDLKIAFEQIRSTLAPFMPQLKTLAKIIGVILLTPLIALIAAVVVFIGVVVATISIIARLIGFLSRLVGAVVSAGRSFTSSISTAIKTVIRFFQQLPGQIVKSLGNIGRLLFDSGKKLIGGLVDGIKSAAGAVKDAVGGVLQGARDLLPFSDAKEGPFSDLTKSGEAIFKTIQQGANKGARNFSLDSVMPTFAGSSSMAVTQSAMTAPSLGSDNNGSNGNVTIQLNMSGVMTRSRSDMRDVAKEMLEAVDEGLRAKGIKPILGGSR
jgi:tape measure domain-containing protein